MRIANEDADYKIIRILQKNGRIPNTEIAKKLGISEATVRNRLQKLLADEAIQIVAVANPFKLKTGIIGNIRMKVETKKIRIVGDALSKIDELWYVAQLAGSDTFDSEFYVRTQNEVGLLIDKINAIDGISDVTSSLIVRYIKNDWGFGVPSS